MANTKQENKVNRKNQILVRPRYRNDDPESKTTTVDIGGYTGNSLITAIKSYLKEHHMINDHVVVSERTYDKDRKHKVKWTLYKTAQTPNGKAIDMIRLASINSEYHLQTILSTKDLKLLAYLALPDIYIGKEEDRLRIESESAFARVRKAGFDGEAEQAKYREMYGQDFDPHNKFHVRNMEEEVRPSMSYDADDVFQERSKTLRGGVNVDTATATDKDTDTEQAKTTEQVNS